MGAHKVGCQCPFHGGQPEMARRPHPHKEGCRCVWHQVRASHFLPCSVCGTAVHRMPSRIKGNKTGFFFCGPACQDSDEARRLGYRAGAARTTGAASYRDRALRLLGPVCCVCGYAGICVEVDHIDGDRTNNEIENLQVLCPTHHTEKGRFGQDYIIGLVAQRASSRPASGEISVRV